MHGFERLQEGRNANVMNQKGMVMESNGLKSSLVGAAHKNSPVSLHYTSPRLPASTTSDVDPPGVFSRVCSSHLEVTQYVMKYAVKSQELFSYRSNWSVMANTARVYWLWRTPWIWTMREGQVELPDRNVLFAVFQVRYLLACLSMIIACCLVQGVHHRGVEISRFSAQVFRATNNSRPRWFLEKRQEQIVS
jgi:hypothetical protein